MRFWARLGGGGVVVVVVVAWEERERGMKKKKKEENKKIKAKHARGIFVILGGSPARIWSKVVT